MILENTNQLTHWTPTKITNAQNPELLFGTVFPADPADGRSFFLPFITQQNSAHSSAKLCGKPLVPVIS